MKKSKLRRKQLVEIIANMALLLEHYLSTTKDPDDDRRTVVQLHNEAVLKLLKCKG